MRICFCNICIIRGKIVPSRNFIEPDTHGWATVTICDIPEEFLDLTDNKDETDVKLSLAIFQQNGNFSVF